jgi:hypothetical protein
MEEDQAGELRFAMEVQVGSDGELFYQPQKTRDAWSRNLISIPIYPDKSGRTLIPAYRAVPMSVDI